MGMTYAKATGFDPCKGQKLCRMGPDAGWIRKCSNPFQCTDLIFFEATCTTRCSNSFTSLTPLIKGVVMTNNTP